MCAGLTHRWRVLRDWVIGKLKGLRIMSNHQNLNQAYTSSKLLNERTLQITSSNSVFEEICMNCTIVANGKGISTRAIWDTGASETAVSESILKALGADPIGEAVTRSAAGVHKTKQYVVGLLFSVGGGFRKVTVTSLPLPDIGVLIGLDIICKGETHIYRNSDGNAVFEITF